MRPFDDYNPIAHLVYFASVAAVVMFTLHPVVLALSIFGALLLFLTRNGAKERRYHLLCLALFCVMTLINPLFQHNGATVLFVLNHNPVTLEALLYGALAATSVCTVLYWFRIFSQIMTADKLLYLFGRISPKFALILSMALRYIPLFATQTRKVSAAQKGMGLYREDNLIDNARGGIRIFSVMVTWALENGIITADSMAARGYGIGRRSSFSLFRFRRGDLLLTLASVALCAFVLIAGALTGALDFTVYPTVQGIRTDGAAVALYAVYAVLAILPTVLEIQERIRWKYLQSNI